MPRLRSAQDLCSSGPGVELRGSSFIYSTQLLRFVRSSVTLTLCAKAHQKLPADPGGLATIPVGSQTVLACWGSESQLKQAPLFRMLVKHACFQGRAPDLNLGVVQEAPFQKEYRAV